MNHKKSTNSLNNEYSDDSCLINNVELESSKTNLTHN